MTSLRIQQLFQQTAHFDLVAGDAQYVEDNELFSLLEVIIVSLT